MLNYQNTGDEIYGYEQKIEIDNSKLYIREYLDTMKGNKISAKYLQNDSCNKCLKRESIMNLLNRINALALKCAFGTNQEGSSGGYCYSVFCKFGTSQNSFVIIDMRNEIRKQEYLDIKALFENKDIFKFSRTQLDNKYKTH